MDRGRIKPKNSKWRNKAKISLPRKDAEEEEEEEEEDPEKKTLLPSAMAGKRKSGTENAKGRVQWNDDHGDQLVQVLEFFPSDSSDSEDEFVDSCMCKIM